MTEKKLKRLRISVVILPLLLFSISLTQIAFTSEGSDGIAVNQSYLILIGGPFIILGGATFEWLTWMANPLALYAIISFLNTNKKPSYIIPTVTPKTSYRSLKLAITSTVIAWQFSLWKEVMRSESGAMGDILSFNAGYWLWASSILLLAVGIGLYFALLKKFSKLEDK